MVVLIMWACSNCRNAEVQPRSLAWVEQVFPAPMCRCGHRYTFQGLEVVRANSGPVSQ